MIEAILLVGMTMVLAVLVAVLAGERDAARAQRDRARWDAAEFAAELEALERMQEGER